MEFTYQSTMQLPASYAVLSEDEMVYTVGGAFELNINAQDVLNFTVNVGVNLVRMLGQAAISNTIAGIIDMRNDGLTTMGAIEHYWGRQTPVGKTMTVVAAGFAGVYVYYWARSAIESFLSIYNDMLPEEELPEIFGGGELGDALDSFTDNLHLDDFFLQGGILSISISFVPLLLFNVVVSGYRFVENIYKNLSNWFGYHDDTFSAVSSFTDEMRQKQQQRGI